MKTVFTDTIAAIATAQGAGGVGIVRISGPEALSSSLRVFKPRARATDIVPMRLYYGTVFDPASSAPIDDGFLVCMRAPASYTGEDVVELQCHGGALVLKKVLEAVLLTGVRMAGPGEFTRRAFLSGKLDLAQAEAVIDVIRAGTDALLEDAAGRLGGRLSARVNSVKEKLLNLVTRVEAELDFPDEDVDQAPATELVSRTEDAARELRALLSTYEEGSLLKEGARTVILGRPNVGKSSLLNLLLRRERAIVHDEPGTTRDVIEDSVNIRGVELRLMDTAGLRRAHSPVESIGIKAALDKLQTARLVIFVIDASAPGSFTEDRRLLEEADGKKTIVAVNKTDIAAADVRMKETLEKTFSPHPVVFISARTGAGMADLEDAIYKEAIGRDYGVPADRAPGELIVSVRQKNALISSLDALKRAQGTVAGGLPRELAAADLRAALNGLGEITGEVTSEDILDKIFSEFCIGK